jgi:hypothetical protein
MSHHDCICVTASVSVFCIPRRSQIPLLLAQSSALTFAFQCMLRFPTSAWIADACCRLTHNLTKGITVERLEQWHTFLALKRIMVAFAWPFTQSHPYTTLHCACPRVPCDRVPSATVGESTDPSSPWLWQCQHQASCFLDEVVRSWDIARAADPLIESPGAQSRLITEAQPALVPVLGTGTVVRLKLGKPHEQPDDAWPGLEHWLRGPAPLKWAVSAQVNLVAKEHISMYMFTRGFCWYWLLLIRRGGFPIDLSAYSEPREPGAVSSQAAVSGGARVDDDDGFPCFPPWPTLCRQRDHVSDHVTVVMDDSWLGTGTAATSAATTGHNAPTPVAMTVEPIVTLPPAPALSHALVATLSSPDCLLRTWSSHPPEGLPLPADFQEHVLAVDLQDIFDHVVRSSLTRLYVLGGKEEVRADPQTVSGCVLTVCDAQIYLMIRTFSITARQWMQTNKLTQLEAWHVVQWQLPEVMVTALRRAMRATDLLGTALPALSAHADGEHAAVASALPHPWATAFRHWWPQWFVRRHEANITVAFSSVARQEPMQFAQVKRQAFAVFEKVWMHRDNMDSLFRSVHLLLGQLQRSMSRIPLALGEVDDEDNPDDEVGSFDMELGHCGATNNICALMYCVSVVVCGVGVPSKKRGNGISPTCAHNAGAGCAY